MQSIKMLPAGESGLVVEFGKSIDPVVNARVHRTAALINRTLGEYVREVVPTYRSLLVYFDPLVITRQELSKKISSLITVDDCAEAIAGEKEIIEIPVCYGGEYGPDIGFVARHNGLTVEEVINIHTSTPYQVYMIGFTPGFPYLGGMSEKIAAPRLEKPRTLIPAGSVGIAGSQTGFYPTASPGGWRLIGRTPVKGFDKDSPHPFPFKPGVYLRFVSVSEAEYLEIKARVETGTYRLVSQVVRGEDAL